MLSPTGNVPLERERLQLPDGDFLDLDWSPRVDDRSPTVLILHGLEGSSRSHYARRLIDAVAKRGWRAVVMHFRGCSGTPNRLLRSYHSGDTGDIDFVAATVRQRLGPPPLITVGYSLGGNVLLKWLGERGHAAPVDAAVAVSVPFMLAPAADRMERGISRIYQRYLLKRLKASAYRKLGWSHFPIPRAAIRTAGRFRDFDDAVTAPLHGFKDADEYYRRSSSRQYLPSIRKPTLIIHSRDDPFMTPNAIPGEGELPEQVILELSDHGGHVGFVTGSIPLRPRYWLEPRITGYVATIIQALERRSSTQDGSSSD